MKNKILTTIFLLFAVTALMFAKSGKEILDQTIEAMGGANLSNVNSSFMQMTTSVMGMTMPTKSYKKGDKYRLETNQMGQDVVVTFNGEKGWMKMGEQVMEMPAEKVDQTRSQTEPMINGFKDKINEEGIKIEKVGKSKIDGITTYHIKMTDKDGQVTHLYINSANYLIVKMTANSDKGELEILFKDYKDFDGVKVPVKTVIKASGMEIVSTIEDYQINPDLNYSLFEKP
jgi:outer membrane lipoprotein-sorting protein